MTRITGPRREAAARPRLEVLATAGEASARAADLIAAVLRRKKSSVLVLASGKTMRPVYRRLVRLSRTGRAPFSRASTFNLDELAVSPADPRSFRSFMESHLFFRTDIDRRRIHFLRGDAEDRVKESERYEAELTAAGPADVALVGIGVNGHVAYLEPGASLPPTTSSVRLSASTRAALAADGVDPVPREALTMGIESILSVRRILLLATGRAKAAAVSCALEGRVTPGCPASFLSLHPGLTVVLDRAAAAGLRGQGRGSAGV